MLSTEGVAEWALSWLEPEGVGLQERVRIDRARRVETPSAAAAARTAMTDVVPEIPSNSAFP
jgi:hypothetical protein